MADSKVLQYLLGTIVFSLSILWVALNVPSVAAQELRLDPALVKGPDACGECHKSSVAVWKDTHHATTFQNLPRSDKAKEIAKSMGIRRIKNESDCLTCHFTSAIVDENPKPIAGITCESCHGEGKNWIDVHSDFGGKGVTADTEDPVHKVARYEKSEAEGLIRPSQLYAVAQNCYNCHTVPNEKLVNIGGHTAGSKFELVAWSQGEVRHNVWYSKENNMSSLERRRMMYIIGQALDLEFALRGVAKATVKAKYAVSMAKRAKAAEKRIQQIAGVVNAPEIQAILVISDRVKLKLNNEKQLVEAADAVAVETKKISANYDGTQFAEIDSLLPKVSK